MQINKVVKRAGITALVLTTLLLCLHFFIRHRARQILNYIVTEASNGQYRLDSKQVKFKYFPLSVAATELHFYPTDSLIGKTYYTATADAGLVELSGIWSLISNKRFHLRKISISHPQINVYNRDTGTVEKISFNIRLKEMQDALVKSLAEFNVDECIIKDAAIFYKQNINGWQPLSINHITLSIDSLRVIKKDNADTAIGFQADVRLSLNKPIIQLPDSNMKVEVGTLMLDTKQQLFTVNQFNLYSYKKGSTVGSINLSEIRLKNFNWMRWLQEGVVEIDSVKASNGFTFFDFSDRQLFALGDKKEDQKIMQVNVPMMVHSVEINKIQYGLRTLSSKGPFTVQLNGDSLGVNDIFFSKDSLRPVQIGSLAFKVTNYINSTGNKENDSQFDKLVIDHNNLEFQNFHRSFSSGKASSANSITIPSLKVINFSLDDLLQYKLKADKLILEKPALVVDIHKSQKKQNVDEDVSKIARSLQASLDIKLISIRDAAIILNPKESPTNKITIENLSTEIDARQLLASKSVMDIVGSATALTTTGFKVTGNKINLEVQSSSLNETRNGVNLKRVKGSIGDQVEIDLQGVSLLDKSRKFDLTKLQTIEFDNVTVQSGHVNLKLPQKREGGEPTFPSPSFIIHSLNTGSVDFDIKKKGNSFAIKDIGFSGKEISINNGVAKWGNLDFKTGIAVWLGDKADIHAGSVSMKSAGVFHVNNINVLPHQAGGINTIAIPEAIIHGRLEGTGTNDFSLDKVELNKPLLQLNFADSGQKRNAPIQLPTFSLKELVLNNPHVTINKEIKSVEYQLQTESGNISIKNITSQAAENLLKIGSLELQLAHPKLLVAGSNSYMPEQLNLQAKNIIYDNVSKLLETNIDTAQIKKISLHFDNKFTTEITDGSIGIAAFQYSSKDSFSLPLMLRKQNWWASAATIKQEAKQHNVSVYNPYVSSEKSLITFDSLTMLPNQQREAFWESMVYEKDYLTLKMGNTSIHHWQIDDVGKKGVKPYSLSAESIKADSVFFWVERDKTKKADSGFYKPLLAQSLRRIPFLFSVDTVQLGNSFVRHNVIPEKSRVEGNIFFTDMNGFIFDIKNKNYLNDDSLRFRLRSKLMGESDLSVAFRQSYTDTLQGFWLRARMGKMNMSSLNSLLVPLLSVKIERGNADTMLLLAQGNDYVAYGTMDLRYKGLRVSLLRKGENEYFLAKVFNWLINIVVREEDHAGKSILFQERFRNRSIYNYWAKIAIKGLLANLGIKKDKNQLRKYRRFIKENKLPDYSGDQWQGR